MDPFTAALLFSTVAGVGTSIWSANKAANSAKEINSASFS